MFEQEPDLILARQIVQDTFEASELTPAQRRPDCGVGRLVGLDGLRAGMMLLGIVLHAANAHAVGAPNWWPVQDDFRSGIFDAFIFSVHSFRMELFFLLAGFFARLLMVRHGVDGFTSNRCRRVLLPLLIGVGVMIAVMASGLLPAPSVHPGSPTEFPAYVTSEPQHEPGIAASVQWHPWFRHLWFLEYLLIFYVGVAGFCLAAAGREDQWLGAADAWLFRAMRRPWLPFLMAGATAILLLPMPSWVVPTPLSIVPDGRLLAYYSLFVACGWMLHRQPSVLTATACHWNWRNGFLQLAVGLALATVLWQAGGLPAMTSLPITLAIRLASALFTWLFMFQLIGAAMLLLNRPNNLVRYLADAAFWCYLVHLPIVLFLQQGVAASLPGYLRFPLALAVTIVISIGSYHLLFRSKPLRRGLGNPVQVLVEEPA
jgi:glucan biosynthesis protein C